MKNYNYITVQGWMVNELHLSGSELLLYALIYGFSQDGETEYYGSQSYMAESLGISRESVLRTIKKLENKGLVKKIPSRELFKEKLRYKAIYRCDEMSQHDVSKCHNSCDEMSHNNIDNNNNKEEDKSSKKKEAEEFIDRMYKLYPAYCPKRNHTLGKSQKDKVKIAGLLRAYSMEQIEAVIQNEIDTKYGNEWMQNFSTFLNNFPDPNCIDKLNSVKEEESNVSNNNNKWQTI